VLGGKGEPGKRVQKGVKEWKSENQESRFAERQDAGVEILRFAQDDEAFFDIGEKWKGEGKPEIAA
jgi:hypothetical protein